MSSGFTLLMSPHNVTIILCDTYWLRCTFARSRAQGYVFRTMAGQ